MERGDCSIRVLLDCSVRVYRSVDKKANIAPPLRCECKLCTILNCCAVLYTVIHSFLRLLAEQFIGSCYKPMQV